MKALLLSAIAALSATSAIAQVKAVQFAEFREPRLGSYVLNMDSNFDGVCFIITGKKNNYVPKSAVAGKKLKNTVEVNKKGEVIEHAKDKNRRSIAQVSCYL